MKSNAVDVIYIQWIKNRNQWHIGGEGKSPSRKEELKCRNVHKILWYLILPIQWHTLYADWRNIVFINPKWVNTDLSLFPSCFLCHVPTVPGISIEARFEKLKLTYALMTYLPPHEWYWGTPAVDRHRCLLTPCSHCFYFPFPTWPAPCLSLLEPSRDPQLLLCSRKWREKWV